MIYSTLIYIEKDEKYLMLHRVRKKNDLNHDKWIGVGGKFEPGETPEACARREALEETGLILDELSYRGIVLFESNEAPAEEMHLFTSRAFHGEIKDCDEGVLEWIEKTRLFRLPIWEGDKIFLSLLQEDAPFFRLSLRYRGDALADAKIDGQTISLPYKSSECFT